MAPGSRRGVARNRSEFQRVRVVLPAPFAPAMKVSMGRFTGAKTRAAVASWAVDSLISLLTASFQSLHPPVQLVPFSGLEQTSYLSYLNRIPRSGRSLKRFPPSSEPLTSMGCAGTRNAKGMNANKHVVS